jgi:hypothetical protein
LAEPGRRRVLLAGVGLAAAPLIVGLAKGETTMISENKPQAAATARTMRVAQMTAFRKPFQVVELPVAAPRADGAVIRVEASGVCRSDWHFWNRDLAWLGMNLTLPANTGHEVGGVVEEVGRDVRSIKVGDRVTVPFHESDGTCPHCRAGLQNLCDNVITPGVQRLGGWAQYVTVTAADLNCIKLPEPVDTLSAAALGCRFMTAYHAVIDRGAIQPGEWTVAIFIASRTCAQIGSDPVGSELCQKPSRLGLDRRGIGESGAFEPAPIQPRLFPGDRPAAGQGD